MQATERAAAWMDEMRSLKGLSPLNGIAARLDAAQRAYVDGLSTIDAFEREVEVILHDERLGLPAAGSVG